MIKEYTAVMTVSLNLSAANDTEAAIIAGKYFEDGKFSSKTIQVKKHKDGINFPFSPLEPVGRQ